MLPIAHLGQTRKTQLDVLFSPRSRTKVLLFRINVKRFLNPPSVGVPQELAERTGGLANWSLLTNHGRLLLAIENEPGLRVRDMADRLALSERGIALILRDLREAGYVSSRREGRRAFYSVVPDKPLRRDPLRHQSVSQLLGLLAEADTSRRTASQAPPDAPAGA